MLHQRVARNFLTVFLVLLFFCPAFGQFAVISTFKGVELPRGLNYQGKLIEKGTYDLKILKLRAQPRFFLRIEKDKKVICLMEGERLEYEVHGMARRIDPSIPNNATLKMKDVPEEKAFYIVAHTGRRSMMPFIQIRVKMMYAE
jgi:hypothetical protein